MAGINALIVGDSGNSSGGRVGDQLTALGCTVTYADTVAAFNAAVGSCDVIFVAQVASGYVTNGLTAAVRTAWMGGKPMMVGCTSTSAGSLQAATRLGLVAGTVSTDGTVRRMWVKGNHALSAGYPKGATVPFRSQNDMTYGGTLVSGAALYTRADQTVICSAINPGDPIVDQTAVESPGATAPARTVFIGWMGYQAWTTVVTSTMIPQYLVSRLLQWVTSKTSYTDQVLSDLPMGYWKLNETGATASAVLTDSSGNARHGTYGGTTPANTTLAAGPGPLVAEPSGNVAPYTNGNGGALGVIAASALPSDATFTNFTIEFWMKTSDVNNNSFGIGGNGSFSTGPFRSWHGGLSVYNLRAVQSADGSGATGQFVNGDTPDTDTFSDNNWHHVVAVYDRSLATATIYYDGVPYKILAASPYTNYYVPGWANTYSMIFGSDGNQSATNHGFGYMAHVAIYNRALNAERVRAHYVAAQGEWTDARLYFPSSGAPSAMPAFSSMWEDLTQADRRPLLRDAVTDTPMTAKTLTEVSATNAYDVLAAQYVSEPLAAQSLYGDFVLGLLCSESQNAANAILQGRIYVVSSGGVERGVLWDGQTFTGTVSTSTYPYQEMTTAQTNRVIRIGAFIPGTITVQDDDRLVVEVGVRFVNTTTTSMAATLKLGDAAAVDDMGTTTLNEQSDARGYLLLKQPLAFKGAASPVIVYPGYAQETDTAPSVTFADAHQVGFASEADAVFPVGVSGPAQVIAFGRASELDQPQALTPSLKRTLALTRAVQTSTALALTRALVRNLAIGRSEETTQARTLGTSFTTPETIVSLGRAVELSQTSNLAMSTTLSRSLVRAQEADEARGLSVVAGGAPFVGMLSRSQETSTARVLAVRSAVTVVLSQAEQVEAPEALAVVAGESLVALGRAVDASVAQPLGRTFGPQRIPLSRALETQDVAPLGVAVGPVAVPLVATSEQDEGVSLAVQIGAVTRVAGRAQQVEVARPLGVQVGEVRLGLGSATSGHTAYSLTPYIQTRVQIVRAGQVETTTSLNVSSIFTRELLRAHELEETRLLGLLAKNEIPLVRVLEGDLGGPLGLVAVFNRGFGRASEVETLPHLGVGLRLKRALESDTLVELEPLLRIVVRRIWLDGQLQRVAFVGVSDGAGGALLARESYWDGEQERQFTQETIEG